MYDYYFSDKKKIKNNPEEFILFCKRLLTRSCNSFPDSQIIRIFRYLKNKNVYTVKLRFNNNFVFSAYLYKKKFIVLILIN